MSDDAMNLDNKQAVALAHLVVARLIHHTEEWLEWEDYPNLGELAFRAVESGSQGSGIEPLRSVEELAANQWD